MKKRERVDVSGSGLSLDNNPFASLSADAFGGAASAPKTRQPEMPAKEKTRREGSRGRVDVIRQKAGRGGKTVTVLSGFKGIGNAEMEQIARDLRKACGVGGTLKGATIEIQGDQCDRAVEHLAAAGFRPIRAGG